MKKLQAVFIASLFIAFVLSVGKLCAVAVAEEKGHEGEDHAHGAVGELAGGKAQSAGEHGEKEGPSGHAEEKGGGGHAEEEGHGAHADEGDGHGEEEPWAELVGPGKAVEAFDPSKSALKLAPAAVARLGITLVSPKAGSGGVTLPLHAIVWVKGEPFAYFSEAGWYRRRPLKVRGQRSGLAEVTGGVRTTDQVAADGSGALRLTELDLTAGESAGHGH